MEKKYGTVDKIRTLQVSARPLIRFSLNGVNCLIASHSLNFLAEVRRRDEVSRYRLL